MKVPKSPPSLAKLTKAVASDAHKIINITKHSKMVDEKGRYLPWDQMRFKQAPDSLSIEEHWLGTRLARLQNALQTPFQDKDGKKFTFNETDFLKRTWHTLDTEARGALTGENSHPSKDSGKQYFIRSLLEEPYNSSVLEGAATTRDEAKKMIREKLAPRTKGERMIMNNYIAMNFIRETTDQDLTIEIIHEIQRIITDQTLEKPEKAGKFRNAADNITVGNDLTGEIYHIPPRADELPDRLQLLCDFANGKVGGDTFIHPIAKAIIIHFMLAYDHPYIDGNGRTARALFYWAVLRDGYWLLEYISISKIINLSPAAYGKAFLFTETDEGDLTYFLMHQAEAILKAVNELKLYLKGKQEELDQTAAIIKKLQGHKTLNYRQTDLLNLATRGGQKAFTISDHLDAYGVSYLTARKDLEDLAKLGLLKKTKNGKQSIYRPTQQMAHLIHNLN